MCIRPTLYSDIAKLSESPRQIDIADWNYFYKVNQTKFELKFKGFSYFSILENVKAYIHS